ncbi:MAG: 2-oxo-4-hydroxy-4-carboxy-5-ureidoimidazoline decarboxylase [Pseudomonadota bacterium]
MASEAGGAGNTRVTLAELNRCSAAAFADCLGSVFEHAGWVARAAAAQRPFADADALHGAMLGVLRALPEDTLVAFLCGHPELAGAAARTGSMTGDSVREQGGLALGGLPPEAAAQWDRLNAAYRARFGFPFILCIVRHSRDSALAAFGERLGRSRAEELAAAVEEIGHISRLRLALRVAEPADSQA